MPEPSGAEFTVALANLGAGEVILDLPEASLYEGQPPVINGPATPSAQNLRLLNNLARARPGFTLLATPDTDRVTGLFFAIFDDGNTHLIRATKSKLYEYTAGFNDISGAATFTSVTDDDYWSFAMVRRTGSVSPQNEVFASDGVNEIKAWPGSGNFVDVAGSPAGARVLLPFGGRVLAMNHLTSGNRHGSRITRSIVGDPRTFTGLGSGTDDLDEDPYPITRAVAGGGGFTIYKGDETGGSLIRATPTGNVNTPFRYDALNPGVGVGLLLPRTLILISPSTAFFVGHDGFYLHDLLQGLRRIGEGLVQTILQRINADALDAAHSWYKPSTSEIHVAIPTSSPLPDEVWVFNLRSQRSYGPYKYGAREFTASNPYIDTGSITWGDLTTTWGDLPYSSWGSIGGSKGTLSIALGDKAGGVYVDVNDPTEDDAGNAINTVYETGVIRAEGRQITGTNGQPIVLGPNDIISLRSVTIEYIADVDWEPTVDVSTNEGQTWTTISLANTLASTNGQLAVDTYYGYDVPAARQFKVRVYGSPMILKSIYLRFNYAGDTRNVS